MDHFLLVWVAGALLLQVVILLQVGSLLQVAEAGAGAVVLVAEV